jgi:hypothetical protein
VRTEYILVHLAVLQGVLFSPFIHSDLNHLYNNSIPTALMAALQFFLSKQSIGVLLYGFGFQDFSHGQ